MLSIEARGIVYDATTRPISERVAFFTGLCRLGSGSMLCGFQVGARKHALNSTIRVCRSDNDGSTWRELPWQFESHIDGLPGSLGTAEMVEVEPGRLLLFTTWFCRSEPDRPLFDPITEGILKSKQLVASSSDEGASWSAWSEVPTANLKGCATTGPPLLWKDGTLAYAFESFKEYDDPRPGRHAAWVVVSRDGGRTFEEPLLLAQHPEHSVYYWDQRLCLDGSGAIVALFWTHDLAGQRDLSVHSLRTSLSDGGLQPNLPQATGLPGQIAAPWVLEDGRLLAFVVDRGQPGTLKIWASANAISDADADSPAEAAETPVPTWPEQAALCVHTHDERALVTQGQTQIDFKQYWEDMGKWSFGHPAIRGLDRDRLLVAYYAGTPDCMSIHWARVRTTRIER